MQYIYQPDRNKKMHNASEQNLAGYATKSSNTKGRQYQDFDSTKRLTFEIDRNRILHSKAFRRLNHKTQVFVSGTGDHYRTRLTHTLEVAQLSRGISRQLKLNEDLSEAIALAHDLGHPPFAHAGEQTLNKLMKNFGLHFEHNEQSKRVVETLENLYPNFKGLNLSHETLEGLIKHKTAFDQDGKEFEISPHLEAQVVNLSDEIAYLNHDIDDGLRSKILTLEKMKSVKLWKLALDKTTQNYKNIKKEEILISRTISNLTKIMIENLTSQTLKNLEREAIKTEKNVYEYKGILIEFSIEFKEMIKEIRNFLYDNFYMHETVVKKAKEGEKMIKKVFEYYYKNIDILPQNWERNITGVKDYIAGMTDQFLIKEYQKLVKNISI